MPTRANENFIPRNTDNHDIQEILDEYSAALEELVNFGSHVAGWSAEEIHGGEELAPLFLSFRHIFELIDAISILVKNSSIEPCKILLRSVFESVLTVKYIFQKDTRTRGRDFMTCCWHHAINELRKGDPDDCMHKDLLATIKKTDYMKDFSLSEFPDAKAKLNIINDHLNSSEYEESEKEYQRLRKAKVGRLDWYSMHDGPSDIWGLADSVGLRLEYDILYREWSGLVHGFDIIMKNIEVANYDEASLSQIRLPTDAYEVTCEAMQFGLEVIPRFIECFVPDKTKEEREWFSKEYEPMKKGVLLKNRIIVR